MKKLISLLLICMLCISFVGCSMSWQSKTLSLEGETTTISISSNNGYSFEYYDNEIVFYKDNEKVATGFWYKMSYYDTYKANFSKSYDKINVPDMTENWKVYQSRMATAEIKNAAILDYNSEEMFFLITSDSSEHIIELAKIVKIK